MNVGTQGLIKGTEAAWEIAYAQKPFIDIAQTARSVGQLGIASEIEFAGEREAQRVEEISNADKRSRQKLIEEQAFLRLCRESDEDIVDITDFKLSDPTHGNDAWNRLFVLLEDASDLPVRFVEYSQDKFALVGDVATTACMVSDSTIVTILKECAWALEASREESAVRN